MRVGKFSVVQRATVVVAPNLSISYIWAVRPALVVLTVLGFLRVVGRFFSTAVLRGMRLLATTWLYNSRTNRSSSVGAGLAWTDVSASAQIRSRVSCILGLVTSCPVMAMTHFLLLILVVGAASAQTTRQSLEAYFRQTHELEKQRDFTGAEKAYQEALSAYPDNPDLLKALGALYQEESKFQEAIEVCNQILKRAPLYPGVNFLVGVSYYGLNRYNEAIDALNKELQGDPKDRKTRYYLALTLQAAGKRVEAIQQLENLLAEDPKDSLVLYQLARHYKTATLQTSKQLASLSPDSDLLHALRGEIYSDNNQNEKSIEEFTQVLKKNPEFPGIHFSLGEVYWKMQENEKAVLELRLALEEDVNHTLANFYLADILIKDQKFQDAIPHLKISVAGDPKFMQAYFLLGKCLSAQGQLKSALGALTRAAEIDPNHRQTHYQLSQVYARLNDREKSQKHAEIFERLTKEDREKVSKNLETGTIEKPQ